MYRISAVLAVLTGASLPGFAASTDVPTRETAGVEQERFEDRADAIDRALEGPAPAPEALEETEETAAPGGPRFVLRSVRFTGTRSFPSSKLEPLASEWIGREVTLAELQKLASAVKTYYRERGRVAAYVYIPPQDVTDGNVQVAVAEGKLGQVRVEGNKHYAAEALARPLRLAPGDVVSSQKISSGLAYLNENQDLRASAVLKPGVESETTDILLRVEDRFPLHLDLGVNNTGTKSTGRERGVLGLTHNNLTGRLDKLSNRYQFGEHSWGFGTEYVLPVEPNLADLSLSYSTSAVDLGGEFRALDVEGDAQTYGVDYKRKVLAGDAYELSLNAGFDWKSVENSVLGRPAGSEELRIFNFGANLETQDHAGRFYFPNTFHVGLDDFLGSSEEVDDQATRPNTGGEFFIYRTSLIRYQRLPHEMILVGRASAQLTPDRLPPSEQFRLGGAYSVRGYPESEYLSDYGAFGSAEVYVPTWFFPADWKLPGAKEPLRKQIQMVAFFDAGAGALRKPLTGERDDRALAGYGGGFRIHLYDKVFGRLQWADAIGSKATDGSSGAFYYGISMEIF